jgi:carbamoyltransferase
MGDDGLAVGACYLSMLKDTINPKPIKDVYLGPEYTEHEIETTLIAFDEKIKYKKFNNIEEEVAKKLSKNKIIARFSGRMEYGPRALCNRTILYSTIDKSANDWLNKQLNRTEFMPFAPVCLEEDLLDNYVMQDSMKMAMQYMTITVQCRDKMNNSPAVVHIDNTARPQFVNNKSNKSMSDILKEYKRLTGFNNLVNTSFNMHEEPIVCSPEDACRPFLSSNIDYLAIGNFLVEIKK